MTGKISVVHAVYWTGSRMPYSTSRSSSSDIRCLSANGTRMAFIWIGGMDPSVWSTTGGLFTVPRVSENNSLYSSIRSCTEDSATLCTPTSRMSNGLNHFFPSRLRRGPLTTTTGSDPLNELNLTERETSGNGKVPITPLEAVSRLILYSSSSTAIEHTDWVSQLHSSQWIAISLYKRARCGLNACKNCS
ncbi:hypothetical protein T01_15205 [Trichinella spiralis]|uniref:Uncharacterized protein n=1 Tax=Trichinella spiralis TaxID=6334 RepID=A0A0V1BTD6_TRISP|nr:hypothetical protein T01_15205 [Trichinella spiralis]